MIKKLKIRANALIFSLIALLSSQANAALITEEWTVIVTSSDYAQLTTGSLLTWQVSFDETAELATEFDDGFDGIAKTADDFAFLTESASCPSGIYCGLYQSYVDFASADIDNLLTQLDGFAALAGLSAFDISQTNKSVRAQEMDFFGGIINLDILRDQHFFQANQLLGGTIFSQYMDNNFAIDDLALGFDVISISKVSQNVPEPSTVAIFALGIFGLMARSKTKK